MIHSSRGTREPPSPDAAPPPAPPEDGPAVRFAGAAAPSDARVVARSRTEPEAFAELYDRHAPAVHRYVRRRLGEQAAEDVVAETFLAAFRQRNRYDTARPDARPWLYGIAANLVGKHRRSETRKLRALARTGVDPVADTATERVDERLSASSASRRLARALAGLSAGDREVLLLAAWADLTYEQIGEALSIPVGTVRSRLHRARRKVREALGGADPTRTEEATE